MQTQELRRVEEIEGMMGSRKLMVENRTAEAPVVGVDADALHY